MRHFLVTSLLLFGFSALRSAAQPVPNIVFIFCDNLGNGDIACFNPATKHRTPHLDQMASPGPL
jgi:arylsulfatase A